MLKRSKQDVKPSVQPAVARCNECGGGVPVRVSVAPDTIVFMKVMTGISSITLLASVASLDSRGGWWIVALIAGLCSLSVLFYTCGRLGYFVPSGRLRVFEDADIIDLEEARARWAAPARCEHLGRTATSLRSGR